MHEFKVWAIVVAILCVDVESAPAQGAEIGESACTKVFVFGLWGWDTAPHDLGMAGLVRDMRRRALNCLVAAPRVHHATAERDPRLAAAIDVCARHHIYVVPYLGVGAAEQTEMEKTLAEYSRLVSTFKNNPIVLGWYITDEPPPEFLPQFLQWKDAVADAAPSQPALCLFYRPDSVATFGSHQPVLLSDCYPIAHMHDGTSLGPHFALRDGPLKLSGDLGRYNMWGTRGVLEWMDLCRALAGHSRHWVTLQVFESGDGRQVRWRQPTAPELRLQTYLAIAGGAKGIHFFRYGLLVDAFGNPLPSRNGENTPLLDEIGRLGAEITPLGPLLVNAEVAEPLSVMTSRRPTADPGDRIEVRRLRSKGREVDYLVAFNNDVLLRSVAEIMLSPEFVEDRRVYDLHDLQPVDTEALPGGILFTVDLSPGGGRIFALASEDDFLVDKSVVIRGRYQNEADVFEIDLDLARRSGVPVGDVELLWERYQAQMANGDCEEALRSLRVCERDLEHAILQAEAFSASKEHLEHLKSVLPGARGDAEHLAACVRAYENLLARFWNGEAAAIEEELAALCESVKRQVK
jgi:hypothetical protein